MGRGHEGGIGQRDLCGCVPKQDSGTGEGIDPGGCGPLVPITGQVIRPEGIDGDDDHIRDVRGLSVWEGAKQKDEPEQEDVRLRPSFGFR